MLKIFPKYLNFENISKKCIRVPGPLCEWFLRHYGGQLKTVVEPEAGEKIDRKR